MKKKNSIYTIQHNEEWFLPMWIKYYEQFFAPEDMYIVSHNCFGPVLEVMKEAEAKGINIVPISSEAIFDHDYLLNQVHTSQRNLLQLYDYVFFTDCDEFIVPIHEDLGSFMQHLDKDVFRCIGYDVYLDKMYRSGGFDKTLITSKPITYCHGYHFTYPEYNHDGRLELYHLHKWNKEECKKRNLRLSKEKWDAFALSNRLGYQNFVSNDDDFDYMFHSCGDIEDQSPNLIKLLEFLSN